MKTRSITMLAAVGIIVIVAAVVLAACGDTGTTGSSGGAAAAGDDSGPVAGDGDSGATSSAGDGTRYDIAGQVRQLTVDTSVSAREQGILGSMLVVAAEGDTTSAYDKASVTITTDTRIWRPVGEGAETLTIDDLAEDDTVIVVFTGPVAESYPVQATAQSIEIVPGTD